MNKLSGHFVDNGSIVAGEVEWDDNGLIQSFRQTTTVDVGLPALIFVGVGDIHVHCREDTGGSQNYKEDFTSAARAAVNGGVTYLCDMPNNPIPPIDEDSYSKKCDLLLNSKVPIIPYAGIGPGTRPLSKKVPYKAYMGPSVGELFFEDEATLEETLSHYKGQLTSFHCEHPEVLRKCAHHPVHHEARPVLAEVLATKTLLKLIRDFRLQAKFCHYSTSEGLDLVEIERQKGLGLELEATPQHLFFGHDIDYPFLENPSFLQMNPPIRHSSDQKALWKSFCEGRIEYLATDHAPHTFEENTKGISGLPGLDTYGPFMSILLEKGVSLKRVWEATCANPGKFFSQFLEKGMAPYQRQNWGSGVGQLKPGYLANFTLMDFTSKSLFKNQMVASKSGWSPFSGIEFPASIPDVWVRGKQLKKAGKVLF